MTIPLNSHPLMPWVAGFWCFGVAMVFVVGFLYGRIRIFSLKDPNMTAPAGVMVMQEPPLRSRTVPPPEASLRVVSCGVTDLRNDPSPHPQITHSYCAGGYYVRGVLRMRDELVPHTLHTATISQWVEYGQPLDPNQPCFAIDGGSRVSLGFLALTAMLIADFTAAVDSAARNQITAENVGLYQRALLDPNDMSMVTPEQIRLFAQIKAAT